MTENSYSPRGSKRKTSSRPRSKPAAAKRSKRKPAAQPAEAEAQVAPKTSKRAQQGKARRRRRTDFTEHHDLKLNVAQNALDPDYEYRWINDEASGRILNKTVHDDWDVVSEEQMAEDYDPEKDTGEGTPIQRVVGTTPQGEPKHAYLCRKPREFHEEDQALKQKRIDEVEEDIRRKPPTDAESIEAKDPGKSYIPEGTQSIAESVE